MALTRLEWYNLVNSNAKDSNLYKRAVACVWSFAKYTLGDANASANKKAWAEEALKTGESILNGCWIVLVTDDTIADSTNPDALADEDLQPAVERALGQIYTNKW